MTSATCSARKGPNKRREFFYWTDDGNLAGLRYEQWKAVFLEQKAHGFDVWAQPMVQLRLPLLFNLRPTRSSGRSIEARRLRAMVRRARLRARSRRRRIVGQHLMSFQQFPPRQRPGSLLGRTGDGEAQQSAVQATGRAAAESRPMRHPTATASLSHARPLHVEQRRHK